MNTEDTQGKPGPHESVAPVKEADSSCMTFEETERIVKACLSNAEDLMTAAEEVQKKGISNVAYHLAALALEEIGKASLVAAMHVVHDHNDRRDSLDRKLDDHVKKLFWAVWLPAMGRELITKEIIETIQGLAKSIHGTRLRGLYVSVDRECPFLPRDAVTANEAQELLLLARSRIELAKCDRRLELTDDERRDLSWFLKATDDPEKRDLIFGRKSMEKLVELGHVASWIRWMRQQFEEADAQGRAMAERELKRARPTDDEAAVPKWRLRVHLYTNSHSIRREVLASWNGHCDWIKLIPVDKKKNELLVDITLPRAVPAPGVWWAGWGVARKFVIALNMGSLGYFWWYVPQQISRFYEKLTDLDANAEMRIERNPVLRLDWHRDALSEHDLRNAAACFGMIPGPHQREEHEPFNHYGTGLALLSKNDIHLQFEPNAYDSFYRALKTGMRQYGDWDGAHPFEGTFSRLIGEAFPRVEDPLKWFRLGEQFGGGEPCSETIGLSEVGAIKLLCDAYFIRTFRRLLEGRAKQEGVS